jgi:hypothetical protein
MVSQLFKQNVPIELLFSLLEKICLKTDKYYLIDHNAYKKLLFYNYHKYNLNENMSGVKF